ncbi:cytidyltransferase-related domain protein [Xylanimonas cellulosilytica DSM 15894]|uniref:Cytidyltransferase-related domain protein n=1 Tax=Xylanimonas cellulosilytica (strain DSM 15894 / JCM 12276 / CECT 5975 / KCTC 9989 / LMG 20990 / NBRC 107835 / XIL07) TaxID=446471 RepID=D1BX34_XYLCX|nr:Gfo/Idh/MocA family oxidoreductase [Xylanimonas cellulosilytica]ACZ31602.1 cytidyltransferase-related domain protein [Xylanimonas cellulosilytica DSM 15894]
MTRVITYGTFDLFHDGHRRILERARELGDHLVVGVTSDAFDESRGKLDVTQSVVERIENVRRSGLADEIIVEEYQGQKIRDIVERDIDIFTVGSDWIGKFDYLGEYCEVVYLERTRGVSSTELRAEGLGIQRIGIVGTGRIARRFVAEARYVSGVTVDSVFSPNHAVAKDFVDEFDLRRAADSFDDLIADVDAVYIASPHGTHVDYTRRAIDAGVHVLCEKPVALRADDAAALYAEARARGVVLLEALKTAQAPGFRRLITLARSGTIGTIRSVDATFTKLVDGGREYQAPDGGAISELASYNLLAIVKLLGSDYVDLRATKLVPGDDGVETFARIDLTYAHATASCRVGIGAKSEGSLVVTGEKGYIYVPAPWWLTSYFEERFEDSRRKRRHYYRFDGDGLRYEISEFLHLIRQSRSESFHLTSDESVAIARMIEEARADTSTIIR